MSREPLKFADYAKSEAMKNDPDKNLPEVVAEAINLSCRSGYFNVDIPCSSFSTPQKETICSTLRAFGYRAMIDSYGNYILVNWEN